MGDRPTKVELLEAVRGFIDRELLPELEGVRRFHARVASNVLAIVGREIELESGQLGDRHARLTELLEAPETAPSELAELDAAIERLEAGLCERIRAGEADDGPWRGRVLAHLAASVRERLAVSNPDYR